MSFLKLRLALAVAGFAIWTGWLAYQAYFTGDPIVVSRPQVLVAPIIVEARIEQISAGSIQVSRVLRGQRELGVAPNAAVSLDLLIDNLPKTRGFDRAGNYLLALAPAQKDGVPIEREGKPVYEVVRIPPSPGFPPYAESDGKQRKRDELLLPPIYPSTESTRFQIDSILQAIPEAP